MGGAVGGAVVIAIAALGVFFLRRQPRNTSSASFVIDVPSQPNSSNHEYRKPLSDDGSYARSSTVGEPIVPMRRYVRILSPLRSYILIVSATPGPD